MAKLILTPSGIKHWELVADFRVLIDTNETKEFISVPKGYRTDLASVPRIFWSIIPPFGNYSKAAVVHDYLYYTQSYTRKECDQVFYDFMIVNDVYKWKAKIMWLAVRMFGGTRGNW